MALQEAGALMPTRVPTEEAWRGEEDLRGVEEFIQWFAGQRMKEMMEFGNGDGESDATDYLNGTFYTNPQVTIKHFVKPTLILAKKLSRRNTAKQATTQNTKAPFSVAATTQARSKSKAVRTGASRNGFLTEARP